MGLDNQSQHEQIDLGWINVLEASSFVVFTVFISLIMGVKLEMSLIISGIRCVAQLTMMGYVLDDVFKTDNIYVVLFLSLILVILGTYELVFNRAKKTFNGLFFLMFFILLTSNCFVAYLGSAFVLQEDPFWKPTVFIPIVGMLLGNSMGSVAMATERCLDQVSVHAPLLETRLSYGATRFEACLPLAIETIRLAMIPTITQLSVMGMINIPGMMTGQLMAGTPMKEAVIYQQCIMFMVAASSTFGVVMAVWACMMVLIDKQQVLRVDKIVDTFSIIQKIKSTKMRNFGTTRLRVMSLRTCVPAGLFRRKRRHEAKYEEVELR